MNRGESVGGVGQVKAVGRELMLEFEGMKWSGRCEGGRRRGACGR